MGVADAGRGEGDAAVLARLRAAEHGIRGHAAHAGPGAHAGPSAHAGSGTVSVDLLRTDREATPDVRVELAARAGRVTLADGRVVRRLHRQRHVTGAHRGGRAGAADRGLRSVNTDAPEGVTLHWHGVDVP